MSKASEHHCYTREGAIAGLARYNSLPDDSSNGFICPYIVPSAGLIGGTFAALHLATRSLRGVGPDGPLVGSVVAKCHVKYRSTARIRRKIISEKYQFKFRPIGGKYNFNFAKIHERNHRKYQSLRHFG